MLRKEPEQNVVPAISHDGEHQSGEGGDQEEEEKKMEARGEMHVKGGHGAPSDAKGLPPLKPSSAWT